MIAQRQIGGVVAVELTTGGAGYTAPPSVSFSGGGGTGAAGIAEVAGGQVNSIVVVNAGTGYTSAPSVTISGSAAGKAYVYTDAFRPVSLFQGRKGEVYGVDGMGRGFRLNCGATAAVPIGLAPPSQGPAITASSASTGKYVASIHLNREGAGYTETPVVTISGGTPTTAAKARADMRDGAVRGIVVEDPGSGYLAAPAVSLSGGFHANESFGVKVSGGVANVRVLSGGTDYTIDIASPLGVTFSTAQGLTNAYAIPAIDEVGRIQGVQLLAAGTGATTTGVTAKVFGGGGKSAVLAVDMRYSVTNVTVNNGGSGHLAPPVLTFRPAVADPSGFGAEAVANVSGGAITSVTVRAGGSYELPPSVLVNDTAAEAVAVLAPAIQGKYLCAVRFLDADGVPSSISHLTEVDVPDGTNTLLWTLSFSNMDARVSKVELWRTSANQEIVLYRVATLAKNTSTYSDVMTEPTLVDPARGGFGLLPITLPSGQLNARRFGVPPGNYAYAAMFQDRAWFAGDTTGERPNSLMFSEVDEPESVPFENEIVLQENAGEHDTIVGLLPMGSELLIVQTGHIYSLRYVAQPIIDASLALVAYRGALSNACCAVMGGAAFLVDSYGLYAYDGQQERALSAAVDNYWRDRIIDFSKASQFHVSTDYDSKVLRFHYCKATDAAPIRALCFCLATEVWWEEVYPTPVSASTSALVGGKRTELFATTGAFRRFVAGGDAEGPVAWQYRSGNMTLANSPNRSIGVVYTPTATKNDLALSLHYNGSTAARTMPVVADRGTGFVNTAGGTAAVIDMGATRSTLGPATGYAEAMFAGRLDPRSAGADRHLAIAFAGTQAADPVAIHGVTVEGVT